MIFSAIPDILVIPEAVNMVSGHLGYPKYLNPFPGVARLLGATSILITGFPRIKEWAYAGLAFDLTGATYSSISVGDPASGWIMMIIPIGLLTLSFFYTIKN